jgi:hypothetical protein
MTLALNELSILGGTDDGDSDGGYSFRIVLNPAALTAATGNQCQITILWSYQSDDAATPLSLSYFGQGAEPGGSTGPTFTGNQVKVTWNGGSSTLASDVGAEFTAIIASGVLTVSAMTAGTIRTNATITAPLQSLLTGSGVTAGTQIASQITGSAGSTGTYQLTGSPANIAVGETMYSQAMATSDTITLGETFDHTHAYVFAFDIASGSGSHQSVAALANVDQWDVTSAAGTLASQPSPTGSWSETASSLQFLGQISITATAGTTPYNPWPQQGPILAQRRKSVGWLPPRYERHRKSGLLVPNRKLILPKKAA